MNKKRTLSILLILIVFAALGGAGYYYYQTNIKDQTPDVDVSGGAAVRNDGQCRIGIYAAHSDLVGNLNNSRSALPLSTLQSAFNVATSNIAAGNKELRTIVSTSVAPSTSFNNLDFLFVVDANLGQDTPEPTKNSATHQNIQNSIKSKWLAGTNLILMGDSTRHTDGSAFIGDHAAGTVGPYTTNISNGAIRYLYDQQLGGGSYYQEKENWGHFRNNSGEYFLGFAPRQTQTLSSSNAPAFINGATLNYLANTTPGMLIVDPTYAKCIHQAQLQGGNPSTGDIIPTSPTRYYPASGSCIAAYISQDAFTAAGSPHNGFMLVDGNYGAITKSKLVEILQSSNDCKPPSTTPTPDPEPDPTPDPIEGPGGLVLTPVCIGNKPAINISWNVVPSPQGYFVDLDINDPNVWRLDANINNFLTTPYYFWNKRYSGDPSGATGARSGTIPNDGFYTYFGGDPSLNPNSTYGLQELQPNTSYKVRVSSIQPTGGGNPVGDPNGLAVTTLSCIKTCFQCNQSTFSCNVVNVNYEQRCNGTDGYYTAQATCQSACAEPTKTCYRCNSTTFTCQFETVAQSAVCNGTNGLYTNISQCTNGCAEPTKTCYRCNTSTSTCNTETVAQSAVCNGTTGLYSDNSQCTAGCVQPTKSCYTCNSTTNTCNVEQVPQTTVCDGTGQYYDNQTTCNVDCTPIPDPTIEKNGVAGTTGPEQTQVSYTVTISNSHTAAQTFDIRDYLPPGITSATSISNSGTYDSSNNVIIWDDLVIQANGSVALTYTLTVPRALYGQLENIAQVVEYNSNTIITETTEEVTIIYTDLSILKDGQLEDVDTSEAEIAYTLQVSNPNEFAVSNVTVRDALPIGVTAITNVVPAATTSNVGTRTLEWTGLTFAALETKTFTYDLTIGATGFAPQGPDSVDNTATVLVNDVIQDEADETIPVDPDIEATISKATTLDYTEDTVTAGYTIIVTNIGDTNIVNYSIEDDLDSKVTTNMVSNISNSGSLSNGIITWEDVDINVGQTLTFTYTVTISRENPGDYENVVVLLDESDNEVAQDDQTVNVPAIVVPTVITPEPPDPTTPAPPPAPAPELPETSLGSNTGTYIMIGMLLLLGGIAVYKFNLSKLVFQKLGAEDYTYAELEMKENNKVEFKKKK